jgi:hypothetical protein
VPCYANYNYISWLANQMSEKGSAKPHANSIDFTSRTSCQYAGREGLVFLIPTPTGTKSTVAADALRFFLFSRLIVQCLGLTRCQPWQVRAEKREGLTHGMD